MAMKFLRRLRVYLGLNFVQASKSPNLGTVAKGVNFVLEVVWIWLGEQDISVYHYLYISIHKYIFVLLM